MLEMRKIINLFMAVNERDNAMTFFLSDKENSPWTSKATSCTCIEFVGFAFSRKCSLHD